MVTLAFSIGNVQRSLTVDVVKSNKHGAKVTLSKHRMEGGVKMTDHAESDGETYELEGFVTDTPVSAADRLDQTFPAGRSTRSFDAGLALYQAKEARSLFTITTPFRVYRNMILTSLEVPDPGNGGVHFSASFEQARFATTQNVVNPLKNEGKDLQPGGSKPTTPSPEPVKPSWLWSAGDATATKAVKLADWYEKKTTR